MNTGKFATLCGVEKRTLFHYDEIGLLKPATIKENGYREYHLQQIHDMDMIKIFQSCGYTLAEIKEMFSAPLTARIDYIQKGKERIQNQIQNLQEMQTYLETKQNFLQSYHTLPSGTFNISHVSMFYDVKPLEKLSDHYFSFLQDGTFSSFIFHKDNHISLCKRTPEGAYRKEGTAITFFMDIKSDEPNVRGLIKEHLETFHFDGENTYYVENLPHFLLENPSQALLKVIVFKNRSR